MAAYFRSPEVFLVALSLAWVLPGLGLSWWEQQFPEDGCVEGTKDRSVEVDDSPKGRPQLGELSSHQPEGSGQLWTPFSGAALQHGLEEALHPFSCVWWGGGGKRGGKKWALSSSSTHPSLRTCMWTEMTQTKWHYDACFSCWVKMVHQIKYTTISLSKCIVNKPRQVFISLKCLNFVKHTLN